MSWSCSLALVEAFSERGFLDGASCALLRSIRTAERSCFGAKKRVTLKPSPSGMMSDRLMASPGVEEWISSLSAHHAKAGVSPGSKQELMTSATFGPRRTVSSKRSIPDTSCSRMCPGYAPTCPWSSETCEELGTPSKGPSWLPPPLWVRDILGGGSGYAPTATAADSGSNRGGGKGRTGPLRPSVGTLLRRSSSQGTPPIGSPNPDWLDWYVGLPIGWSGLQPLGTYRFRQWLEQHGSC